MIGTTLAGRYEIIARVGGGGMALVYKSLDVLLNRYVAVKVLRQQFVHDEEFIRRFRREAQSAASLSHPNVVSVYDVGQEEDIHFIVMEYVEGYNLNEIIKERAPLQSDEAVRIAMQICDALDHAHHNHIIHRDIKPHNILIGNNGRVKVTDFGIARAVTSSTITQTGSVVGSVHYFSPEHAKGVSTGEKSDLYSLGIVLYQMLTGKLPFLGESPISVALKHLQEPFEEPRLVNPLIPQSVENVILKSMRKNPIERYQSAKEMLNDLDTCLQPERMYEPKVTFANGGAIFDDEQETRVMPAIRPDVSTGAAEYQGPDKERYAPSYDKSRTAAPGSLSSRASGRDEGSNSKHGSNKPPVKKWVKPTIWIGSTLVFLGILISVVFYVKSLLVVDEVKLPDLVKLTEEAALQELAKIGIHAEDPIIREPKEGFAKGIVFNQSKAQGTMVKEGSSIKLYVSEGEPAKPLPDLKGLTFNEAVKKLLEMGFDSSRISEKPVFDEDAEIGVVVGMTPEAGAKLDPRTGTVKLDVSKGKESFGMPNLVGMTKDAAIAQIEASQLKLAKDGIIEEASFAAQGSVIKQYPYEPNDPVIKGAEVKIYVSSGYPPEAINYTFNLPVTPAEEGKTSTIRIVYTDARGENMEWGSKKINTTQVFSIPLVLAPNKDGVVSLHRDGKFVDTYPISYSDAKQGTVPIPEVHPVDGKPDDGAGQAEEGHGQHAEGGAGQGNDSGGNAGTDTGTGSGANGG
ncbi:Stk1 family PASTA domain-containing Ser/Thr kinase [Paenibacillus sp. ACRRX]|uniref:Stk1 family PASTA domain-containing Ser/Thr kinase n=1 Tax=Paenibacillus sp. ACRRX TaxID=2918206 RepID=UPI001EF4E384|nr:Stk1 family PASTA domain-containing Ser/Thr kinase [Paenibacillus sp. ACRRX]MCG7407598.1 Stk1 family PASTA domain-containing Ser/Thr kinase [Paenibacillus sp. ACRRX]